MKGSLRKPRSAGGSWAYRIDGLVGAGQARRQIQVGGFATEADAAAALADAVAAHSETIGPAVAMDTVAGFVRGRWMVAIRGEVAESAWRNYRVVLDAYVLPRIGDVRLTRLTKVAIEAMYVDLLSSGRVTGGGLSPTTIGQIHRTVRRMLNDAVRWGLIRVNPAIGAHVPRIDRRPLATWTVEETQAFLRSTSSDREGPLWSLALHTGMRRGELAGLRWRDVDLDRLSLSVVVQRTTADYRVVVVEPKAGSRRTISIAAEVADQLRSHREAQNAERAAVGLGPSSLDETVFQDRSGRPNHPQRVRARFASACAKAGVRPIRLHDLRHTSASMALAAGIHQKIVQERLGHTSVKMTLDVYSHVGKNLQDAAAGELYRWMSAGVPVGDRTDPAIGESLEETPAALRAAARPRVRTRSVRRRPTRSDRVFVAAINEA